MPDNEKSVDSPETTARSTKERKNEIPAPSSQPEEITPQSVPLGEQNAEDAPENPPAKPALPVENAAEPSLPSLSEEKAALEKEIAALRAELRQQKEQQALFSLFPELEGQPLPGEVTAMAETGVPLAACYALYHCMTERKKILASEEQAKNRLRSSGSLGSGGGTAEGNFTLAEISAMSRKEVRKHYREILRSLEKGK